MSNRRNFARRWYRRAAGGVSTRVLDPRSLCHGDGSAHRSVRSSGAPAAAAHPLSAGSLSLTRVGRGQAVKGRANSCSVHANFRLRRQCRRQPGDLYRTAPAIIPLLASLHMVSAGSVFYNEPLCFSVEAK